MTTRRIGMGRPSVRIVPTIGPADRYNRARRRRVEQQSYRDQEKARANRFRLVVVAALIVLTGGAVVALTRSIGDGPATPAAPAPTAAAPIPISGGGEVPAPPGITNPAPYQYDPATNRHFDPNHGHWHAGPPPAPDNRRATSGDQVPAPPGITNPAPYQYDPATDRHYDPNHRHWHSGPPPAAEGRPATSGDQVPAPPGITNPTPYQYDAATDRHYDPLHRHWHTGPPPQR
jgi:hypothetical protein